MRADTSQWVTGLRGALVILTVATLLACSPPKAVTDVANPDLRARCGLDLNLVVDRSGSIGSESSTVQQAAQTVIDALVGTPSRVRMASFSSTALVHPGGDPSGTADLAAWTWEPVAGFHVPDLPSAGGTNIEGGIEVVRRVAGPVGELTLLFTDGVPNERYLLSPDGHPGVFVGDTYARSEARSEANLLKTLGTHMLAVGVGPADASVLKELSGPDDLSGGGPVETADYLAVGSFGELVGAFRSLAQRMCASTLSIHKTLLDRNDHPTQGAGWAFDITLDGSATAWTQPRDDSGTGATIVTTTAGTTTAAWVDAGQTEALVVEQVVPPYRFDSASCEVDRFDGNGRRPVTVTLVPDGFRVPVGASFATYCAVINRDASGGTNPPHP